MPKSKLTKKKTTKRATSASRSHTVHPAKADIGLRPAKVAAAEIRLPVTPPVRLVPVRRSMPFLRELPAVCRAK